MGKRPTIEETLSMLKEEGDSPARSPMRVKKTQRKKDNFFDILKEDEDSAESEEDEKVVEDKKKESSSEEEESEEESEDEKKEEEEEEESEEEEEKKEEESEDEKKEEEEESEEEEEKKEESDDEEDEVEISSQKILPVTPKRFKVSTPRTPTERLEKGKKQSGSFLDSLKEYRYSVIRFIHIDGEAQFIVCYDPYGQIVFVSVDEDEDLRDAPDSVDVINLHLVDEKADNPLDEAFVHAVKEKVNMSIYGLIFYNGVDYQISERNRKGFFKDRYYVIKGEQKDKLSFPQTVVIVRPEDIFEEPLEVIESNKENYTYIQEQQLLTSNQTFKEIVNSLKKVNSTIVNFDKIYRNHSKNIMHDWKTMGRYSKKFYKKYIERELKDEDKSEYDRISMNMFLRFQFFNQNIELMDKLYEIKEYLDKADDVLQKSLDDIEDKEENIISNVVEREEINRYI
jgi:flagellar biosynthesis GTPase FlhF